MHMVAAIIYGSLNLTFNEPNIGFIVYILMEQGLILFFKKTIESILEGDSLQRSTNLFWSTIKRAKLPRLPLYILNNVTVRVLVLLPELPCDFDRSSFFVSTVLLFAILTNSANISDRWNVNFMA